LSCCQALHRRQDNCLHLPDCHQFHASGTRPKSMMTTCLAK
jgi:hypothetical protein